MEAATSASKPCLSQRKFSHASPAPIASPVPHQGSRRTATMPPAANPIKSVSQAIRRSVTAPCGETSAALGSIQAPQHLSQACVEPHAAQNKHEDHWLHTKMIFMFVLGGGGFYAGLREVLRRLDGTKGR